MKSGLVLIHGIGINDADYQLSINEIVGYAESGKAIFRAVWKCPFYERWKEVLRRCGSSNFKARKPAYADCSAHPDFIRFSSFKSWMEKQDWEGKALDKDLLVKGNKIYGPDTCVFVSMAVNNFIVESTRNSGLPTGVTYHPRKTKKFKAKSRDILGKHVNIGYFLTEEEAHLAYLKFKFERAKELAELEGDPKVALALIERYRI